MCDKLDDALFGTEDIEVLDNDADQQMIYTEKENMLNSHSAVFNFKESHQ
jgi:hypothetical protein